jgi:hypothetical protein
MNSNHPDAATLVLGATPNPSRYANIATKRLIRSGHQVVLVGIKSGEIEGQTILNDKPDPGQAIDTVTLYVGPRHQPEYYDYLMRLAPRRIIFNPGTENAELQQLARENGIEPIVACTLVMLSTGEY